LCTPRLREAAGRCLQAEDTLQSFSADFDFVKLDNL